MSSKTQGPSPVLVSTPSHESMKSKENFVLLGQVNSQIFLISQNQASNPSENQI